MPLSISTRATNILGLSQIVAYSSNLSKTSFSSNKPIDCYTIQDDRFIVGNVKMVNKTKTISKSPLS